MAEQQAEKASIQVIERMVSLLDVLVVWFLLTFSNAPMRFFGGMGLLALLVSGATFV